MRSIALLILGRQEKEMKTKHSRNGKKSVKREPRDRGTARRPVSLDARVHVALGLITSLETESSKTRLFRAFSLGAKTIAKYF